jgi:hypothetical protein
MEDQMKKHFVTFLSPGTIVAESTTKDIDSWDTDKAIKISKGIKERHGALPYGFYFTTRERGAEDFGSKETQKKQNVPNDQILISNMECNKWDKVIINTNSWEWTQPLHDCDVVLSI